MTEFVIGFGSLVIVGIICVHLSLRHRTIAGALLVSYGVRGMAALLHNYVIRLPDSSTDARSLEKIAYVWSRDGLDATLGHFTGPDSYFYSWVLSLIYSFTGRVPLMAQSFSVLAGVGAVYLTWRLSSELWNEHHARKAAWAVALFPTLILYSALTMREAFVVFFLLIGFIGLVRWVRDDSLSSTVTVLLGFTASTFFHGGMFIAILVFSILFTARHGRKWLASLKKARIRLFSTVVLLGMFAGTASFLVIGFDIPKLGGPKNMVDTGRMIHRFNFSNRGMASYPDWAVPKKETEIFWKAPIRIAYFLFAPFVWDLDRPDHLFGWIDGIFYMIIAFFFWRHWKVMWNKPESRAVLLVVLALVFVFGIAIGNFGTGLRHRAKFVACAIALVAPRLPRLVLHRRMPRQPSTYRP